MATNVFISTILPTGKILTSDLPAFEALVDNSESVTVRIKSDADTFVDDVFSTTLYPFNSKVRIYDVKNIIEEDMRLREVVESCYRLYFNSAYISIDVIYCDYLAGGFDPDNSFLTTMPTQRVYLDSVVPVTKVGVDSGEVCIRGVVRHAQNDTFSDDKHNRYERFVVVSEDDIVSGEAVTVPFEDWKERYTSFNDNDDVELLSAAIINGNRVKTIYFLPGTPDIRLIFKNCFNALEAIDLKGLLTEKTKVSKETANVAGKRVAYNQRTEKEYEFVSEGLTMDEARSIDQLLNAHQAWALVDGKPVEIIVTDHTCEIDNNDEAQPTVKFTWQFADIKPRLNAELLAVALRDPGIFTKEFTYHFS